MFRDGVLPNMAISWRGPSWAGAGAPNSGRQGSENQHLWCLHYLGFSITCTLS